MQLTDIFIKRPVLATVVSLVILLLGLRSGLELTVRQYPFLQNAQVTVTVAYPGADAALMEGFITTPLEREIAAADGIDFLTSNTRQGLTTITANLRLNKDPDAAMMAIATKVNKLRNQLPSGSEDPVIELAEGGGTAAMYIAFYSQVLDKSQITDYLRRVVEPQLATIAGVEKANIQGARTYALRVWLQPDRLAAHNLTASEVQARLRAQNVLAAVGETNGNYVKIGLSTDTDLRTADQFRQLVVKSDGGAVVRLGDIAQVVLGAENYEGGAGWDHSPAVFIAVEVRPDANILDVTGEVNRIWPAIIAALPEGLEGKIGYDGSVYIDDAIAEVEKSLIEALLIVIAVIFLFLGSLRNSLIPAVTVPLSLVGGLAIMLALGFTLNLLTLLAMVLAIGMVVDDAIIVMENIHRHIEQGMRPQEAAIVGARELLGPVIAMTITLMAVYAPIGFLAGITGKLFTEFAFTLAGAVLVSGIIALTLTPMMCARLLKPAAAEGAHGNRLAQFLDDRFERWRHSFQRLLHSALDTRPVIAVFGALILASCYFLFRAAPAELAPQEDVGFAFSIIETDSFSSREYLDQYFAEAQKVALDHPDIQNIFTFAMSANQAFMGMVMAPWGERGQPTAAVLAALTPKMEHIAGMRWAGLQPPPLPTPGQGYPVEFVLKATATPTEMARIGDEIVERAVAHKKFFYVAPSLRVDRPEAVITIDRDKAALMGVDMAQLAADLGALFGGGEVNRFAYASRSYKVIEQLERRARVNPAQLVNNHTRAGNGELVSLATLVSISERIVPSTIEHAQQLNSTTIIAVPRPDVTQGEALEVLETIARDLLPPGYQIDYGGASRQFKQEGEALLATFGFALVMIYLVLAAQFESFRDPLIMLVTVPMSICGALLFLNIFALTNGMGLTDFPGMTLNIYTQVGLITLIGVIAKHGILIVEFANRLQESGMSPRAAIEEAASIRLRPVLMTTVALVVAMVPLLTATGPGAAARFAMGLVIATGMTVGTVFTLFVVPAMYLYIGHRRPAEPQANAPSEPCAPTSGSL